MSTKRWALLMPGPTWSFEPEVLLTRLVDEHGARLVELPEDYPAADLTAELPASLGEYHDADGISYFVRFACGDGVGDHPDVSNDEADCEALAVAITHYGAMRVRLAEQAATIAERDAVIARVTATEESWRARAAVMAGHPLGGMSAAAREACANDLRRILDREEPDHA